MENAAGEERDEERVGCTKGGMDKVRYVEGSDRERE